MPLVVVLRPVDVEVDKLLTLLFVVLSPVEVEVDRLEMLLVAVLSPVDVEVDSEVSCPKFTASVGFTPAATLVRMTGVVEPAPPRVTFV
jgi:hypothetical protein